MKGRKVVGLDYITLEFLKYGGECLMECISRVFRCVEGRVSEDCKNTCFVHVYEREEIRISVQITGN